MANFTIADLKALREQLGTGMVDTKKALEEADGDVEKATEILRLKGAKGNAKRADRSTSEGLIVAREQDGAVTLIELACETDFVAKNDRFIALADKVADAAAAVSADSVEAALAAPAGAGTVETLISDEAAIIGEKVELRRVRTLTGDHFEVYLHKTSKDLPPQVGVVLAYTGEDAETAAAASATLSASAMKRSFFATKSVSHASSINVTRPSPSRAATRPSLVERSARFALPFAPLRRRISTAFSTSPSASSSAFLVSTMPVPSCSRRALMSAIVKFAMGGGS